MSCLHNLNWTKHLPFNTFGTRVGSRTYFYFFFRQKCHAKPFRLSRTFQNIWVPCYCCTKWCTVHLGKTFYLLYLNLMWLLFPNALATIVNRWQKICLNSHLVTAKTSLYFFEINLSLVYLQDKKAPILPKMPWHPTFPWRKKRLVLKVF